MRSLFMTSNSVDVRTYGQSGSTQFLNFNCYNQVFLGIPFLRFIVVFRYSHLNQDLGYTIKKMTKYKWTWVTYKYYLAMVFDHLKNVAIFWEKKIRPVFFSLFGVIIVTTYKYILEVNYTIWKSQKRDTQKTWL